MMHRIAARLFNTPLFCHPGKAAAILAGIGGRITGRDIEIEGAEAIQHWATGGLVRSMGTLSERMGRNMQRRGQQPYDVVNGVAVIPVEGSLVHKGAWLESDSGETSYQGIQTQVQAARRDPAVKGVVLEVDSYGGEVSGAFETSDMIAALSAEKPTMAILTDSAYSAGYLLASAARQVVVPEQGGTGSIGVIALHVDMSGKMEQQGLKVTVLSAGAHKADGGPFGPLPDHVAAEYLADMEIARQTFAGRVAKYRGKRLTLEAAMATEARTYRGAAAVNAGLADATGTPFETFQAFVSAVNRA